VSWGRRSKRAGRRRRFGRAGCLLWILAAILIAVLLAVATGGFRLGSKAGMSGPGTGAVITLAA